MNALMLALALRLGGAAIRPLRVLLGAAAGAIVALAARNAGCGQSVWLWLPTAMIMMRIARGKAGRNPLWPALLLFCAAGLVGGMILALWGATDSLTAAYLLGAGAAAAVSVCAVRSRSCVPHPGGVRIRCICRGKQAVFEAMIDSGNTLRDYLTHLPVIVIPEETGRAALCLTDVPLRPIFAQTAAGRQRMHVFAPQGIELQMDGAKKQVHAVIALSPGMNREVPALVPAMLIEGNSDRGG